MSIPPESSQNNSVNFNILFYESPQPMWIIDNVSLRFLEVNNAAVGIYGYSRDEFLSMSLKDVLPEGEQDNLTFLHHTSNETYTLETLHRYKSGKIRKVEVTRFFLLFNEKPSRLTYIRDIGIKKKRQELLEYLNKAGEELALALDTGTALEKISGLIVPKFADWFTINVLKGTNVELLFVKNNSPEYVKWAYDYRTRNPVTIDDQGLTGHILRTGESSLIPCVSPEMLEQSITDKEQLEVIKKLNLHSSIVVPMKIKGKVTGTINFISTIEGREFDEIDLNFARDFATRIALALENARLHEQAQQAIMQVGVEKNKLKTMIMQAPVAMCILDGVDFTIEVANQKMFEFLGIGTEFLNKPVFEGLPHVKKEFEPLLNEVYYNDKNLEFEEVETKLFRHGDLKSVYINFSYQPIKEADGTTSGVLAVAIDVTSQVLSRKKIEEADQETQALNEELTATNEELSATNDQLLTANRRIHESEERLKLAMENTDAGVFDTNMITGITIRSMKHAQIYGYKDNSEEWTIEKMQGHVLPQDYRAANENYRESLASGILNSEFRIIRKDGVIRWINTVGKVYYSRTGKPERIIGTVSDITEKKELQRQRDEFISTVSHELKTPVTSIKAYAQFLQRTLIGEGNSRNKNFLDRMDVQIGRLENLIRDLLDTTRAEAGKLSISQTKVEMNTLLEELVRDLQLITPSHQLIITQNTEVAVFADKERLIQVITNFITNAVKFSSDAAKVYISVAEKDSQMICAVQDFGKGIPSDRYQDIFERFQQVNPSNLNLGLGLGLYISKEIIIKQGGRIWFKSKVDEGSTFYFSLPVKGEFD